MLAVSLFLFFLSVMISVYYVIPFVVRRIIEVNKNRARNFARDMDRTMLTQDIQKVRVLFIIGPFVCGAAGFFLGGVIGVLVGSAVGFVIPRTYASILQGQRREQFEKQLVDALMIMSSSFRGGLSLVQSMESVVDEMPDPIRQEFGLVLGENKIGVLLDDAFNRLYKRLPSPPLQQMISAILLARETGGNLPAIFSRIVSTIRERRKIEDNLKVLTLQGKLQAFVMSGLPVGFFFLVNTTNPNYFKIMTNTDTGRMLLAVCAFLWVLGTFMIIKISTIKEV
jgi:tight adherence protein B